jgi:hypothetical protein
MHNILEEILFSTANRMKFGTVERVVESGHLQCFILPATQNLDVVERPGVECVAKVLGCNEITKCG